MEWHRRFVEYFKLGQNLQTGNVAKVEVETAARNLIMKWADREESENVEDRRGLGKKGGLAIGGLGGIVLIIFNSPP